jgi:hypothetical protein
VRVEAETILAVLARGVAEELLGFAQGDGTRTDFRHQASRLPKEAVARVRTTIPPSSKESSSESVQVCR